LEPGNPFRWLRFRGRQPAEIPAAYVEMINGDRLPGVVVDYRGGSESKDRSESPHLVVRVTLGFEPPDNKPVPEIRVLTQYVRRIVWQRHEALAYQPGRAQYRDGRVQAFRAVRYKSGEVHVLLDGGDMSIDWDDLAELHLPAVDPWKVWMEQLAALCPTSDTRLLQVETTTGLIVTASTARFSARFEGNSAEPDRWVHGLAPVWSLDILWIPLRDVTVYRSFAQNEVPLSRIGPQQASGRGGLEKARPVQIDRSVQGTLLQNRSLEFGWGFGVSGGTELVFNVPAGARSLRTAVCLDKSAEDGGCIRPRILSRGERDEVLWEGPVIVGSDKTVDSGVIDLATTNWADRKLVLQTDAVLTGQPRGADPLDIRDHTNWCDPLLEIDTANTNLRSLSNGK
jgi:hypothetical protein